MRNGTVDRCGVIQIGCDRRNPRFTIINSHPARSSAAHGPEFITATAAFRVHLRDTRSSHSLVELSFPGDDDDDIAWNSS